MVKERLLALCKSPLSVTANIMRRNLLRLKGVSFGSGLTLEGHVDIGTPDSISMGSKVRLGKHVYLGAWPDSELSIGDNTYVGRNCIILAHQSVIIGSDCLIAPGCHITDVNHGIASGELIRKQPLASKPVRIGNDVWIGAGCSILPGVTIANGAVIGARAVVTRDIPSNAVAVGIPSKVIRFRN